ncbi:MAG: DnaB-like helicase C-terminal domain-containing protein, partial [bacterium]
TLAEQAILASMMWEPHPEIAREYVVELQPEDFYHMRHRIVFGAICDLLEEGQPSQIITVHSKLLATGKLDDAGGMAGLMELWGTTPMCVYHRAYSATVREARARRDLLALGSDIARSAAAPGDPTATLLQASESRIRDIEAGQASSHPPLTLSEAIGQLKERLESISEQQDTGTAWIRTGFVQLDRVIVGLEPGNLHVLAGWPSMGKSAVALQILVAAACRCHPCYLFATEMGAADSAMRLLAQRLEIPFHVLRKGCSKGALDDAAVRLGILPVTIDETAQIEIGALQRKARGWVRRLPRNSGAPLIVVDHLHLLRDKAARREGRRQEVEALTAAIKGLARDTKAAVLCLAQLSRPDKRDGLRRPTLLDLRETGAIEQDADLVMFAFREGKARSDREDNDLEIQVAKQRNGPLQNLTFGWDGPLMRAYERVGLLS